MILICLGYGTKVSKIPRQSKKDEELPHGIKYSFINDGHVFKTEGATLRSVPIFPFRDRPFDI